MPSYAEYLKVGELLALQLRWKRGRCERIDPDRGCRKRGLGLLHCVDRVVLVTERGPELRDPHQ